MEKLVIFAVLALGVVVAYPADHREDTVLPFNLSPGNVNLETYYLDKYPQPGSNPKRAPAEDNMFAEEEQQDDHALFRSRREANPQHHHHGHGHGHGHGGYGHGGYGHGGYGHGGYGHGGYGHGHHHGGHHHHG